ncbi:cold shock domain-containing protein E1-like [Dreissena polymorpha]|nr:cold shock domain-containing protein E1-like [Dreissena polymorpha]
MSAVSRKVSNPQWKNFQPPAVQDPAIVSYGRTPSSPTVLNGVPLSPGIMNSNQSLRETGLIEKLLHSYGFVQCCDREARLFFHYSEFQGDAESLKIGDAVEFQMSYDRRNGRPVACNMVMTDPNLVSCEIYSEERFIGSVVQEAKPAKPKNGTTMGSCDGQGRVTYEHNGEWFFLPYGLDDIVDNTGNTQIKPGDQVTFFIATDKRNGNLHARKLEQVEPKLTKYQGVVCSMKDSFGFIERADVVKEIFFHYSEYMGNINELLLGDDIEFEIQTRNGKEVAVNITPLPSGTVIFEDFSIERLKGKVLRTLKSNKRASDPLGGKIQFESPKGSQDIVFGDKDQDGEYTLLPGDIVEFSIATDRRDKLQRATKIVLLAETFEKTTERRETGTVVSLKEGYGFIQCAERDARMFYHFSEVLDAKSETKVQDEVEFTVTQDPTQPSRQVACRIRSIPKGSIGSVIVKPEKYIGTIEKEPANQKSPSKSSSKEDTGTIIFDMDGAIHKIVYYIKDINDLRNIPRFGDKVDFNIGEQRRPVGAMRMAVNVRLVLRNLTGRCQGYIATLKDNYGFIENIDHDKEVFFHFSSYEGTATELELGDEVEYMLTRKSSKLSAENIKKLPSGTIPANEDVVEELGIQQGKVIRPMRVVNPDQDDYPGLIQVGSTEDGDVQTYPYSITSLADKRDFMQKGDVVKFRVAVNSLSNELRAVNVTAVRQFIRAKVESVKDKFGFLTYEAEPGRKLFFHQSEVGGGLEVAPGDEVEFVVVHNQRNNKYSACSLRKITEKRRPERLLSRLKSMNDEMVGPRVVVTRPPKGPDGTKGFTQPRTPWNPQA